VSITIGSAIIAYDYRTRSAGSDRVANVYAVLDEVRIWGIDLEEVAAHLLKEKVAGAVWSRTVTYQPMTDLREEEQIDAREHFGRIGSCVARDPGEAWRRNRRLGRRSQERVLAVNLISHDNGVGLTQDVRLLRDLLESRGHEVQFAEWREGVRHADVNFHIELFEPRHMATAKTNIGLFNLEWFDKHQASAFGMFAQLWAKSQEAFRIYEELGRGLWPVYFTGFASRDMRREVAKERFCLHVRGKAAQKGTDSVLEAWRRHGDRLPRLVITSAQDFDGMSWRRHPNVEVQIGFKSEDEIATLMSRAWWHICPSETEGWGHYIAEAISCESIVVTTNASPMNEHVRPEHGVLLPTHPQPSGLVTRHRVEPDTLAEAVLALASKSEVELAEMGTRARAHWEARQADFREHALTLLSHA
jgi:Glycosyl transferases group 1